MPYVYLIQPVELVTTARYKVGMSRVNDLSRLRSYKNGTRYLCVFACEDPIAIEKRVIKAFNDKYICIAGKEYFECSDEEAMRQLFVDVVMANSSTSLKNENNKRTEWMNRFAYRSDTT